MLAQRCSQTASARGSVADERARLPRNSVAHTGSPLVGRASVREDTTPTSEELAIQPGSSDADRFYCERLRSPLAVA